jgi:hypothetical protein
VGEAGVALVESAVTVDYVHAAKAVAKSAPLPGWALDRLPGRRHVKSLADSQHARDRYPQIERAVRLWAG